MKDENKLLIKYSKLFQKQRKTLSLEIKTAFRDALELYLDDPTHPGLQDHKLKKKFAGYRSIDVTGDYRALYKIRHEGGKEIINFHMIGIHQELYG